MDRLAVFIPAMIAIGCLLALVFFRPGRFAEAFRDLRAQAPLLWMLAGAMAGVGGVMLWRYPLVTGIWVAGLGGTAAGGILLARLRRKRRLAIFSEQFMRVLGVLKRGLRSGLPLNRCIEIVVSEFDGPIRTEFAKVLNDVGLGMPLADALERMADRVPLREVRFFAVAMAVQSRTGGSLTETLENLSETLYSFKRLRQKIDAFSQEARVSATIIGVLPFLLTVAIILLNPGYIGVFLETGLGMALAAGALAWIGIGVMVMRRMIRFDG
ncbi:tight adherence protein B [Rhodovulum bhavnagarense]|uniref:Tight adherence protein B n=1 Tax=Rhodovulum bhavnagarense TaxID=992286 RepID=A0A4R2RC20_9RHOB|nr:type II secretion system F family protein [Rhodovulum bhavnagarense]TCP60910.1 tight adherence protein B [Rhodovulum bhavnagarense]